MPIKLICFQPTVSASTKKRLTTYRVVSWLMLEKDELVRELILLLLRSLGEKKKNVKRRKLAVLMYTVRWRRRTGENLHQLEVFEGRQFLWHDTELVSIQIPERGGTNTVYIKFCHSDQNRICILKQLSK